jgi:hypothetical protein
VPQQSNNVLIGQSRNVLLTMLEGGRQRTATDNASRARLASCIEEGLMKQKGDKVVIHALRGPEAYVSG